MLLSNIVNSPSPWGTAVPGDTQPQSRYEPLAAEAARAMKVLIVDDDDLSLDILEHALVQDGYEVVRASDGQTALDVLRRGDCQMVISDWDMPKMTGIELCQEIRQCDFGGYVYVIMLTSHGRKDDIVAGMSAGADDFIVKPFHAAELAVRVRAGVRVLSLETRDLAIFALAKLAESRDPDTGQHLERVRSYSRILAEQLGKDSIYSNEIDAEFIRLIYLTSPLHDIGKVGIPDSVLLKPGRLSSEEFDVMKTHALLGARTLDAALQRHPSAKFLQIARDIASSHHERWDGSGYPFGLIGLQIPLCARIVSLADVYDALTNKRVYKEAYSHFDARSIIVEGKGSQFDPTIVDAFLQIDEQFELIRERFSESRTEVK
jgi:putative two-component system response regulator